MITVIGIFAALVVMILSPVIILLALVKTLFETITGAPKDEE